MRRQFPVLHRLFLARMIDLEILSARGDVRDLVVRFVSVLAAFSFVLTYLIGGRYFSTTLPRARLLYSIWNDEEFLMSASIAVAGQFAVLAWNAVFPDRRDCLVLGPLPVATPTIILAKLSAMAMSLGVCLIAMNVFTGLVFPLAVADKGVGPMHALAAWWITVFAAGIFIFSGMLALQGLAAQLMSWGLFLRVSGFLQLAALFAVLALFFVTPPFAATILRPLSQPGFPIEILPSFWFTGLLHRLNGDPDSAFLTLAHMALRNLSVAVSVAALTWALSYYRNIRRIVQAPDIAPSAHGRIAARLVRFAAFGFLSKPLDRAILMFTCRTIARSRQHRLLLAACGGIGFATALAFSRTFLEDRSRTRWDEPNVPFLIAGLLLLSVLLPAPAPHSRSRWRFPPTGFSGSPRCTVPGHISRPCGSLSSLLASCQYGSSRLSLTFGSGQAGRRSSTCSCCCSRDSCLPTDRSTGSAKSLSPVPGCPAACNSK